MSDGLEPEPAHYGRPPLTPSEASTLVDALLGFRAALDATIAAQLSGLNDFLR
jgi:hypothetical protein